MPAQRWLRIIPVALIMYTIAYIDRNNVSMTQKHLSQDLKMNEEGFGWAAGMFFWGYLLLQIPGGYLATRWSAKKFISLLLVVWGVFAVGGGLVETDVQFAIQRFLLGVAEGGVFPAALVLLANWFPRAERARATAYWSLCQPLALVVFLPVTGKLMDLWGWRWMLILEGALPLLWLIIWWKFIDDRPSQAKWISAEEKEHIESSLAREAAAIEPTQKVSILKVLLNTQVLILTIIYFFQNCGAYGCMFWLRKALEGEAKMTSFRVGLLAAVPYIVTAVAMVLLAWSSDRTRERRGHVAIAMGTSGVFLLANVLSAEYSFWLAYVFICLAIPGPFANLGPFWAIFTESLPKNVAGTAMGLVNAIGNLGGFFGTWYVGYMGNVFKETRTPELGIKYGFGGLALGLMTAAVLTMFIRKGPRAVPDPAPSLATR